MSKKVMMAALAAVIAFGLASSEVRAEGEGVRPNVKDIPAESLKQYLEIKEVGPGRITCEIRPCPAVLSRPPEFLMRAGKITELGDTWFKVAVLGHVYHIDAKEAKRIVRYYWGASSLEEFSVGDIVNVFGTLDSAMPMGVKAQTIRNVSIQARHGVFNGTIESINADAKSFVLVTKERGKITVNTDAETKFVRHSGTGTSTVVTSTAAFADLKVGYRTVARGIWNTLQAKLLAHVIRFREAVTP